LVYNQNVTLSAEKQNVFVYDFDKVPMVFDNGYPFAKTEGSGTDSTCYVKFYNFLYETAGVPSTLKLQYQYVDPRTSALVNIGDPVSFGETTGWQPVKVVKSVVISAGYCNIYYKIKVVADDGTISGDLQLWNSKSVYASYSDYAIGYIGRRYFHTLGGMRSATPIASVRVFNAY